MADQAVSTDLIIKLPSVPNVATFTDPEEFEKLYSKILDAVKDHVPDTSTKAGRDAIASLAYKVARTKTTLDNQGKALTEEWRSNTTKVNATRNVIKAKLETLQTDVRKPLTDWEVAEDNRIDRHKSNLQTMIGHSKIGMGRTSAELRELLADIEQHPSGPEHCEEFAPQFSVAKQDAIDHVKRMLAATEKQEADARELEELRAAKAEADRVKAEQAAKEEADRIAAERAERERQLEEQRQAELAQAAKEAAARAEREAEARIAAAEQATRDAEEKARRDAEEAQRRVDAAIAEAAALAERRAEAERKRIADEQAIVAAEQARRDRSRAHKKAVNTKIVDELTACSQISVEQAQKIVIHLANGLVPNVTLQY
ncbi:hypothetical protein LAV84_18525 [Rhizobium sp. VS19-DR104.2]|uniref:hypothetical protein n=1 Tax=unclassified Rhizobium TaxID=2613769 RepID=UPI001CC62411|nr:MULTISPECIES: hypothetical protein [unclassified Rhizobium]MBZ5761537.1 hypothetical protein [Rhizobium sp. VS19-DR96]MBZ5767485.1 hypothetical protein [Rhizobium sp. VS19-DR129.2]MBZ5775066.1 hypothetical protein [Rhizobium sp. VS19-DRK62.2]MBZ5785969.1 hypothetical protein [Rhizobium sp. VS19-DR121]MBZ5803395.1 hypothetical protein [Rhizobium sp. VS19-DR181]